MSAATFGDRSCALLDLDNTLFDHRYSLRQGVAAVQAAHPDALGGHTLDTLADAHNRALEQAYRTGMRAGVPATDMPALRTTLFLRSLGLEGALDPQALATAYERAYLADRRATGGSIELIVRLKDAGWRVAIVSDGERRTQQEKAAAIDVWPLVDALVTSEDAGVTKPDARLFALAARACETELGATVMIGDDLDRDVVGALEAGAAAIHYAPGGGATLSGWLGAPAIGHMHEAMTLLGVAPAPFAQDARVLGLDIVTVPRHCSSYGWEDAAELWAHAFAATEAAAAGRWGAAVRSLADALAVVVRCARVLDPGEVEIALPPLPADAGGPAGGGTAPARGEQRRFTARFEHGVTGELTSAAAAVVDELRSGLASATRDHPRAAARALRRAALLAAEPLGVADRVRIAGEGIDE